MAARAGQPEIPGFRASESKPDVRRRFAIESDSKNEKRQRLDSRSRSNNSNPTPMSHRARAITRTDAQEKSCCDRPGCYQRFTPPPRSPLQKFCSASCRKALRCVLLRERRWILRLAVGRQSDSRRTTLNRIQRGFSCDAYRIHRQVHLRFQTCHFKQATPTSSDAGVDTGSKGVRSHRRCQNLNSCHSKFQSSSAVTRIVYLLCKLSTSGCNVIDWSSPSWSGR